MKAALSMVIISSMFAACGGKSDETDACDDNDLFDENRVLQVNISMNNDDWNALCQQSRSITGEFVGDCRSGPFESSYTYFPASIDIDDQSAANIGIRKKGFIGSQSTEKPGFRINLDEYVDDTKLFCTDNITLNNAVQDPSLMRQCLSYKVFRDAGIKAPRCNFARVSMNGEDLGIYVNVEPVKKKFLRENFGDDEGDLYEGTITDFARNWYSTFEEKTDETDATLSSIRSVIDDLETSSEDLETILERHFDLDRLLTFLSAEIWTGHWDGYAGNQNNFFVYKDPETDKFKFIPWGTDGTMIWEDAEDAFPSRGYLANRILRDEGLAYQWYERIGELRGGAWNTETLLAEVDRIEELLNSEIEMDELKDEINGLRDFIEQREDSIKSMLPVRTIEEFSNPACMVENGSIDATFSTVWSNAQPDQIDAIIESGEAEINISWRDGVEETNLNLAESGAFAAPVENGFGNVILGAEFEGENGAAYLLPVVYFDVDELRDDTNVSLDWGGGSLFYMDETTGWEPINVGDFWGGNAHFDVASPVEGEAITGSISSGIFTWVEVTE